MSNNHKLQIITWSYICLFQMFYLYKSLWHKKFIHCLFFPPTAGWHGWYLLLLLLLLGSCAATTCLNIDPLECWQPVFISFFSSGGLQIFPDTECTQLGVCASSATRKEGGQFDQVLLYFMKLSVFSFIITMPVIIHVKCCL